MSTVVQSVVAFELTGSNTAVGFVVFGQGLSMFALGPLGGALADRWPKRATIAICQLVTTCVFFALAALLAADAIHLAFLAAGSFVMGAMFAFLGPGRQAFVVELVDESQRGNAIALTQVANNLSRALGPAVAGALLAWPAVGATGAYCVMGGLYTLSVVAILKLPHSPGRANAGETRVLQDVAAGLRYVRGQPRVRTLMLLFMLVVMLGMPHVTLLPGLTENELGRPAESIALLFGISAAAAFLTSVVVARQAGSERAIAIFVAMGFGFGLSLLVLAWVPSFGAALAAMVLVGIFTGGFQTLSGAVVIHETDPAFVGRVMSLTLMAFGGFGLVALPVGILGDYIGERATLTLLGVTVCGVVLVLRLVLARHRA
jgi:MFS family permease